MWSKPVGSPEAKRVPTAEPWERGVWSQVVDNHLLPTTVGATGILAQMMTSQDRCPSLRQRRAPHSVSPVPTVFDHTRERGARLHEQSPRAGPPPHSS